MNSTKGPQINEKEVTIMTPEKKPIISVITADGPRLVYSVAQHGSRSFRLWINNSCVETIFDTAADALDYAKSCANIDKHLYPGARVEIME